MNGNWATWAVDYRIYEASAVGRLLRKIFKDWREDDLVQIIYSLLLSTNFLKTVKHKGINKIYINAVMFRSETRIKMRKNYSKPTS